MNFTETYEKPIKCQMLCKAATAHRFKGIKFYLHFRAEDYKVRRDSFLYELVFRESNFGETVNTICFCSEREMQ